MRSNAGMANRQGDVNLYFVQVSAPSSHFGLAWLAWLGYCPSSAIGICHASRTNTCCCVYSIETPDNGQ